MTVEQYSTLIGLLPQIEQQLKAKGEQVARPNYDRLATAAKDEEHDEEATSDNEESSEIANGGSRSEGPSDNDD